MHGPNAFAQVPSWQHSLKVYGIPLPDLRSQRFLERIEVRLEITPLLQALFVDRLTDLF
jgi:hypothetical protein